MKNFMPAKSLPFAVIYLIQSHLGAINSVSTVSTSNQASFLDLSSNGSNQRLLTLTINNDYTNVFDVRINFANGGKFLRVSAGGGDSATVTSGSGATVNITNIKLVPTGGTLGSGASAPSVSSYSLTNDSTYGGASFIWNADWSGGSSTQQTTETTNYVVDLQGSWTTSSSLLQGTYQETITVYLTVGDQANTSVS